MDTANLGLSGGIASVASGVLGDLSPVVFLVGGIILGAVLIGFIINWFINLRNYSRGMDWSQTAGTHGIWDAWRYRRKYR